VSGLLVTSTVVFFLLDRPNELPPPLKRALTACDVDLGRSTLSCRAHF
jgi:hypothetical protein